MPNISNIKGNQPCEGVILNQTVQFVQNFNINAKLLRSLHLILQQTAISIV